MSAMWTVWFRSAGSNPVGQHCQREDYGSPVEEMDAPELAACPLCYGLQRQCEDVVLPIGLRMTILCFILWVVFRDRYMVEKNATYTL